jgi:hypothetical protein
MMKARLAQVTKILLLFTLFILLAAPEWPAFGDRAYRLKAIVGQRQFDFLIWEVQAIGAKAEAMLAGSHSYMDELSRKAIALHYLGLIHEIGQLERQIESVFTDPAESDPDASSHQLQEELSHKRQAMLRVQPTAEAILQDQVADILVEQGFEVLDQAWPPVMMHMTPLPAILIVSPRERIERIYGIPLVPGVATPSREAIESQVYSEMDLSALVVNLGGLGTYPAMVQETGSINRSAEIIAHEWAHHWLTPYPITLYYLTDPQIRTMNETVASIVGNEVGAAMVERYYPESVPVPAEDIPPPTGSATPTDTPPPFDFPAAMAETRVRVDQLLAEGRVDEAETYMEVRRQFLWDNGYRIRKINQAYFAFYGAYADRPGETGDDPIGPLLQQIRANSPTLRDFMRTVATIGSYEELLETAGDQEIGD